MDSPTLHILFQVYLVDYGLAYRYMVNGRQNEYKMDPKRTHDGTIEFTSRDAHHGVCETTFGFIIYNNININNNVNERKIYIARLKAYKCMLNLPRLADN